MAHKCPLLMRRDGYHVATVLVHTKDDTVENFLADVAWRIHPEQRSPWAAPKREFPGFPHGAVVLLVVLPAAHELRLV